MNIKHAMELLKSAGPILKHAIASGQILNPQCELTQPDPDILCEYGVTVPMSDGFSLTANLYRSQRAAAADEPMPVIMCAHPYDNRLTGHQGKTPLNGPPQQYRLIPQAGRPRFSNLTSWESPDPNFWVPSGYAVVNLNLPGYAGSEGPPGVFTETQAKCYYEAIEWAAAQPWSTGKVGLNGVSFLAITQYHVAACQYYGGPPPALKCISPWEGLTDMYRDAFCPGGVSEVGFPDFWWSSEVLPALSGTEADFLHVEGAKPKQFLTEHPLFDAFWAEKAAKVDQIDLPMLVCASFSDHGLHTVGSFRAFVHAKSNHKWVYTHRYGKWDVYYSPEVQQLTRDFMDCFLKDDTSSGFLDTPPVRLEVRSSRDVVHDVRYESEWPPAAAKRRKLYFDAGSPTLSESPITHTAEITYEGNGGEVVVQYRFETATEVVGVMILELHVEVRAAEGETDVPDDLTVFAVAEKLDVEGKPVRFYGSVGERNDVLSKGYLRASMRALDEARSTPHQPELRLDLVEKLSPNEVVPVTIPMFPHATFFEAGESLEIQISSKEIVSHPVYEKVSDDNAGIHVIHVGGPHPSHLSVPTLDASGSSSS
ncbi:MAG: CocE/NonD family hydrolase [Acidobacteriota bacterium]